MNPNDEPRRLSWLLRHPNSITEITDDVTVNNLTPDLFPTDPNEKVMIGLNISLNEYVTIASALDVGRDIAYNEQSISVWQLWVSVLEQAESMSCEDVADCIETSPDVQLAITNEYQSTVNQFLLDNGVVNPNQVDPNETTMQDRFPESNTEPISPFPDTDPCDLNSLWAGIRECVERLDLESRDLLEDINVYNDRVEQIFEVIDLVPLLGDIIKDVSDFFTELVPDLLNGYNAFSSPSALDNVACDLFCLVKDECRYPTYDEFLEYFTSRSVAGLATNPQLLNYSQVWSAVAAVPAGVGSLVWHTLVAWNVLTMGFGGKWNGTYGKSTLRIWCSFGEDLPNDNWEILCDCTTYWTAYIPFTAPLAPPVSIVVGTQYAQAIANARSGDYFVEVQIAFGESTTIVEVSPEYLNGGSPYTPQYLLAQSFGQVSPINNYSSPGFMTIIGNRTATTQNVRYWRSPFPASGTPMWAYGVRIKGTGDIPVNMIPYQE